VLIDQVERLTAPARRRSRGRARVLCHRRSTNGAFALHTPEGLSDDPSRPLTFGFEEMDALSPFIDDVYRICEVRVSRHAVMKESGPGQFEINLQHRPDAVAAALDGLLLKRAVKARRERMARSHLHGQAAPRLGRLGMHVH
jgi:glutamine synthetase